MAKKVTVELVDDMDGGQVAAETVEFSLDGVSYEIDLSEKNAAKIRATMQEFIDSARRVGRSTRRPGGPVRVNRRDDLDRIRTWAKGKGKKVSTRGRIAASIVDEYDAEQKEPVKQPAKTRKPAVKKSEPAASKGAEVNNVESPAFSS